MSRPARFKVGDRVVRPADVHADHSSLLHGEVLEARFGSWTRYGYYPEVYDVRWDGDEAVSRGYLPHGLDHEVGHRFGYCKDSGAVSL